MKESERKSGLGSKIEGEMDKWGIKRLKNYERNETETSWGWNLGSLC